MTPDQRESVRELRGYASELRYGSALGVPEAELVFAAQKFQSHYDRLARIDPRLPGEILRAAPLLEPREGRR